MFANDTVEFENGRCGGLGGREEVTVDGKPWRVCDSWADILIPVRIAHADYEI